MAPGRQEIGPEQFPAFAYYEIKTNQERNLRVEHIICGAFANASEEAAFRAVERRLKAEPGDGRAFILTNLVHGVGSGRQPDEIDMVVITPSGAMVIEVKHWDRGRLKAHAWEVEDQADEDGVRYGADAFALGASIAEKLTAQMGVRVHGGAYVALAEVDVRQVKQQHHLAPDADGRSMARYGVERASDTLVVRLASRPLTCSI